MAGVRHSEALGNVEGTAIEIDLGPSIRPRGRLLWIRVENRDAADAWINLYTDPAADVTPGTDRYGEPIHVSASDESLIPVDALFSGRYLSIFASSAADGTGAPTTGLRVDVAFERLS